MSRDAHIFSFRSGELFAFFLASDSCFSLRSSRSIVMTIKGAGPSPSGCQVSLAIGHGSHNAGGSCGKKALGRALLGSQAPFERMHTYMAEHSSPLRRTAA